MVRGWRSLKARAPQNGAFREQKSCSGNSPAKARSAAVAGYGVVFLLVFSGMAALIAGTGVLADDPEVTQKPRFAFAAEPEAGLGPLDDGSLYETHPDVRHWPASTTKSWTLHLAVDALHQDIVDREDIAVVSERAASLISGHSRMKDVNGVSLEAGERVRFEDLLHGMMIPSGNDAAIVIAEHVAESVDPGCRDEPQPYCFELFVYWMNGHANELGLHQTAFDNPFGASWYGDNPIVTALPNEHKTTAREMALWWEHANVDPLFREFAGFMGNWEATSQRADGTQKTYKLPYNHDAGQPYDRWMWYPGMEGYKGGSTFHCDLLNTGCMIASAERLDRRVVVSHLSGDSYESDRQMFDVAFQELFRPQVRATNDATWDHAGGATDVSCMGDARSVVVGAQPDLTLATRAHDPQTGTITEQERTTDQKLGGSNTAVEAVAVGNDNILVAEQGSSGAWLRTFSIDGAGASNEISRISLGSTNELDVTVLKEADSSGGMVAYARQSGGSVEVGSVAVSTSGGLNKKDTYAASIANNEVAIAGASTSTGYTMLLLHQPTSGNTELRSFTMSSDGSSLSPYWWWRTGLSGSAHTIEHVPPTDRLNSAFGGEPHFVTALRMDDGEIRLWNWKATPQIFYEGWSAGRPVPTVEGGLELSPFRDGGLLLTGHEGNGETWFGIVDVNQGSPEYLIAAPVSHNHVEGNASSCTLATDGDFAGEVTAAAVTPGQLESVDLRIAPELEEPQTPPGHPHYAYRSPFTLVPTP